MGILQCFRDIIIKTGLGAAKMKMQKLINLMSISLTLFVAACNGGSAAQAPQAVLTAYPPQFATSMQQGVFSPSGDPLFDENNKSEIINSFSDERGHYLMFYGFNGLESEPASINGGRINLNKKSCLDTDFVLPELPARHMEFKLDNCSAKSSENGYELSGNYFFVVDGAIKSESRSGSGKFLITIPFSNHTATKNLDLWGNQTTLDHRLKDNSGAPVVNMWPVVDYGFVLFGNKDHSRFTMQIGDNPMHEYVLYLCGVPFAGVTVGFKPGTWGDFYASANSSINTVTALVRQHSGHSSTRNTDELVISWPWTHKDTKLKTNFATRLLTFEPRYLRTASQDTADGRIVVKYTFSFFKCPE